MVNVVKLIGISSLLFLFGCATKAPLPQAPGWITDPGDGAVGSSITHVRGRHYQEELAINRARERLAARYGVEVSSVQTIKEKVVNDSAYVTSDKDILLRVNKTTVKAHVREIWHDRQRDIIWAWVYPVSG